MNRVQLHDGRIDWVDYAKGFCIIFVVMMHSTLGVGLAAGQRRLACTGGRLRAAVPHAGFLPHLRSVPGQRHRPRLAHVSRPQGRALFLFLSAVDDHPVRASRRPAWCTSKAPPKSRGSISCRLIDPFGTLWFIYLLPIFFVFIRLTRRIPAPVDLAVRRRARDRARQDRLDGAGRIRRPLRLLLHRLHSGEADLRARRARASAAAARRLPACSSGAWSTARWCISATRRCRSFRSRSVSPAPARW